VTIEPIEIGVYRDFVRRSLAEDLGWGDATVLAVITGNGLKDIRSAVEAAGHPYDVRPDIDAVDAILRR